MSVLVTNTSKGSIHLSGYGAIHSGQSVEMTYEVALRYSKSPHLSFDFANGSLPFKEDGKVTKLTFLSPLHTKGGYGQIGLNAIRGLTARGVDIAATGPIPSWLSTELYEHYPDIAPIITRRDFFISDVGLAHSVPPEFQTLPSPRKVGWTMWEATRIPETWCAMCRQCEHLIVPSSGQVSIFEPAGVPITVVPDGMGVEDFTYIERDPDPEIFTFISWSRMASRKCPTETIECFQRAFPHQRDVRLVMKTLDGMFGGGRLGIPEISDDRITIINEGWTKEQLVKFCHSANAGIFLSHGEGFYNPPTQAMATGLPVILPNHSGCVDQCDERYNYPVGLDPLNPYEPSPLSHAFGINEPLEWWVMDYDAVIETMRHIYNNRKAAHTKGKKAAKWVRKKFSIDTMVEGILSVLNTL